MPPIRTKGSRSRARKQPRREMLIPPRDENREGDDSLAIPIPKSKKRKTATGAKPVRQKTATLEMPKPASSDSLPEIHVPMNALDENQPSTDSIDCNKSNGSESQDGQAARGRGTRIDRDCNTLDAGVEKGARGDAGNFWKRGSDGRPSSRFGQAGRAREDRSGNRKTKASVAKSRGGQSSATQAPARRGGQSSATQAPARRGGNGEAPSEHLSDMEMANKIVSEARLGTMRLIPVRLIHHMPDYDALMRNVNLARAGNMSEGIGQGDVRTDEPILSTDIDVVPNLKRYVSSGNHRTAGTRDSGMTFVPSHILTKDTVHRLMNCMAGNANLSKHDIVTRVFMALELIMVASQIRDPSPRPMTTLGQTAMVRTYLKNHSNGMSNPRSFGASKGLKDLMFPGIVGDDSSIRHFLLNNRIGRSYRNKLVRGSIRLNETTVPRIRELGSRDSALDLLMYWEHKGIMPKFLETHLTYAGLMSQKDVQDNLKNCSEEIRQNGRLGLPVFDTRICTAYHEGTAALLVNGKRQLVEEGQCAESDDSDIGLQPTRKKTKRVNKGASKAAAQKAGKGKRGGNTKYRSERSAAVATSTHAAVEGLGSSAAVVGKGQGNSGKSVPSVNPGLSRSVVAAIIDEIVQEVVRRGQDPADTARNVAAVEETQQEREESPGIREARKLSGTFGAIPESVRLELEQLKCERESAMNALELEKRQKQEKEREKNVELSAMRLQLLEMKNALEVENAKRISHEEKERQDAKLEIQLLREQLADVKAKMEEERSEARRKEEERITAEAEKKNAEQRRKAGIEEARRVAEVEDARKEIAKLREEVVELRRANDTADTGRRMKRSRKPSQRSAENMVQTVCMMSGEGIMDMLEKIKSRARQLGKIRDD